MTNNVKQAIADVLTLIACIALIIMIAVTCFLAESKMEGRNADNISVLR